MKLLRALKDFLKGVTEAFKASLESSATGAIEAEYVELNTLFLTLVAGSLVGLVHMPAGLVLELIPLIKDETHLLVDRAYRGTDVIGDLFSSMGGEW